MSELPNGWVKLPLDMLGMPSTPNIDPSKFPSEIFELYSVPAYANKEPDIVSGSSIHSVKQLVQPGDVLLCKIVPHLNRVWIVQERGQHRQIASGEWIVVRSEIVDSNYLRFELSEPTFRSAFMQTVSGVGGSLMRARTKAVAEIPLAITSINEQRRIVAKLDSLFAHSSRAREELERIPKLCDRYKQAILAAAFRGDLTASWRQKKVDGYISSGLWSIPHQWQWHQMSEVCEHITKGTTPSKDKMSNVEAGIPFIKVYNLTFDGALDFSIDPTFVDLETHEKFLKRSKVYPGDVLMNIVGPPLGKVSIVPEIYPEWNINQAIAIFRARPKILNRFISNYLLFEKTVNWCIQEAKATAGQFNLTLRICQDIPIPVPPIEEQKEIVRQIEKLFKVIDLMRQEYQKASRLCDRLDQATLSKAFRGELVPQDPNDEPASVLLDRIRAERQTQPTTHKIRKSKN